MKKHEITNKSLRTFIFADDVIIEKKTGQLLFYKNADIQFTSDELVGIAPADSIVKLVSEEVKTKPDIPKITPKKVVSSEQKKSNPFLDKIINTIDEGINKDKIHYRNFLVDVFKKMNRDHITMLEVGDYEELAAWLLKEHNDKEIKCSYCKRLTPCEGSYPEGCFHDEKSVLKN